MNSEPSPPGSSQHDDPTGCLPLLRQSHLFSGLPEEALNRLAGMMEPTTVALGEAIIREGDPSDGLYLIESGQAEVSSAGPKGEHIPLRKMGPGEQFGEIGLLTGDARSADVVALGPMKLWKLGRDNYFTALAAQPAVHQKLAHDAMDRSKFSERQAALATSGARSAVSMVLDKLIRQELRALRSEDMHHKGWSFDEIIAFYQSARFLYPAKMQELEARFGKVRDTWERALRGNNIVFKMICASRNKAGQSTITNSFCGFRFSPDCWQLQHLVSGDRHGFTGTLLMLLGLNDWYRRSANHRTMRFTYRPDNPGVTQLFARFSQELGPERFHSTVCDYTMKPLAEMVPALKTTVRVETLASQPSDEVQHFISSRLSALENVALSLGSEDWDDLGKDYEVLGLVRRRHYLVARDDSGAVLGTAICHISSEGMNLSFLENAGEYFLIREGLPPERQAEVFAALLKALCELMQAAGRDYVVLMTDPRQRQLLAQAGLGDSTPKQYAVATFSSASDGLDGIHRASIEYYQEHFTRKL